MINRLLNRRSLARVSSAPGKTASVNFYNLGFCRFTDLPGYGYAKISQSEQKSWGRLVEGYFCSGRDIRLVVQIIDMRRDPMPDDLEMAGFLTAKKIPFAIAASKTDKLKRSERKKQDALLRDRFGRGALCFLPFSSVTGEGMLELRRIIRDVCKNPRKKTGQ